MSEVRVVSDSGGDSVFDSSGDSRHVQGDGPSGTSTPDQSDAEGGETVTVRLSPIKQRKSYKTTPSVKRKMRNTSTHTPSPATSKHVKRRAKRVDVVSIVSESSGEGEGLSQAQQLLKTNKQSRAAHKKQHAPLTTVHSTKPPSPQQATAPVHPIKTPLLPTPQVHTDTYRTRGEEEGGWQTVQRQQTRTHGRQTNGQTHTGSTLQHTHASTNHHSQHTQPAQINTTYRSHNSGARPGGVGGSASSAAELVEFPVILTDRGAGATRFRSLGPWFDGLDFGPGVGRPRQVRPLQGGRWLIACVSAVQQAQIGRVTSVGGVPVSCSVPAVSVDGVVRPIPLGADAEQRLLADLASYKATAVQRLLNRQGAPSLAVRVTYACETLPCQVKVGLQVFEVAPYAARVRRTTQ